MCSDKGGTDKKDGRGWLRVAGTWIGTNGVVKDGQPWVRGDGTNVGVTDRKGKLSQDRRGGW